jgi:hypothetical protein
MKKVAGILTLCLGTFCFSACSILNRDAGPCYGQGCPVLSAKPGPPTQATAQKGPYAPSPLSPTPSQPKRGE